MRRDELAGAEACQPDRAMTCRDGNRRVDYQHRSVPGTRPMQRRDPVRRLRPIIADPPLLGKLRHRMDLVLDRPHITIIDHLPTTPPLRRQPPLTNPATNRVRATPNPRGCLGNRQHASDGSRGDGASSATTPGLHKVAIGRNTARRIGEPGW